MPSLRVRAVLNGILKDGDEISEMTSSRQSSEKGEQATSALLGASELEQCKSAENLSGRLGGKVGVLHSMGGY